MIGHQTPSLPLHPSSVDASRLTGRGMLLKCFRERETLTGLQRCLLHGHTDGRTRDPGEDEESMVLTLVASSDDRALAIRDHVLPLVRERGTVEVQRGSVRLTTLEMEPWVFHHWTPFSDLSPDEASAPGYRHAIERQHATPDLPYGLEIWRGLKVLSVLWVDAGDFEVPCFVRGSWEDEALALTM